MFVPLRLPLVRCKNRRAIELKRDKHKFSACSIVHHRTASMQKQVSTSSTTAMLQEALERERAEREGADEQPPSPIVPESTATITITGLPVSASHTIIPIREEFRCRRFWFFYHDLRAFATSVRKYTFSVFTTFAPGLRSV